MTSLDQLDAAIKRLDPQALLAGLSYDKTYNQSLGLSGDPSDFKVFIPYKTWPSETDPSKYPTTFASALEDAFKDVLAHGSAQTDDKSPCFIDIAHLDGGLGPFFTESTDGSPSIAQALADIVNRTAASTTPIVRFLAGTESIDPSSFWASNSGNYNAIFWPNGGPPLITHPKAEFHVGFYSPNFRPSTSTTPVETSALASGLKPAVDWLKKLVGRIKQALMLIGEDTKAIENALENLNPEYIVKVLIAYGLPSISWNHAKIVAVGGKTMMTGGGNYWSEYTANHHDIVDMQSKYKGDAAISAHTYADYFWRYLNRVHTTDTQSFRQATKLSTATPNWSPDTLAPLFDSKPIATSGIPVLTVAKLGDWAGPMNSIQYPVQLIDALRDLMLNIVWSLNIYKLPSFNIMPQAVAELGDDNSEIMTTLSELGVTSAAWATRYARTQAVANAVNSLHISTELLVNFLQVGNPKYQALVNTINTDLGLTGNYAWNGYLWPFDLLVAFGQALARMKNSASADAGIFIVLTTNQPGEHPGWEDDTKVSEVKSRLKAIMTAMATSGTIALSPGEVDKLVESKFQVKRVLTNSLWFNHCKVVCVDRRMMYIGSDNTYPNYNEEHGCWIEDEKTVAAWFTSFYDQLWLRSTPATD
ncbi:hypothetical protein MMC26_002883 [Xylographa opegraphella]|nr:hypothetical protein [Xylographa opegraphella]